MKLDLLYFGHPAEQLKCSRESVDAPDTLQTVAELLAWLRTRGNDWATALGDDKVRCARNQRFCTLTENVSAQDEIAFFSPISGG